MFHTIREMPVGYKLAGVAVLAGAIFAFGIGFALIKHEQPKLQKITFEIFGQTYTVEGNLDK